MRTPTVTVRYLIGFFVCSRSKTHFNVKQNKDKIHTSPYLFLCLLTSFPARKALNRDVRVNFQSHWLIYVLSKYSICVYTSISHFLKTD